MANKTDAVALEVFSNALLSISEEMGALLIRTAYSTNIKERHDASTAIFDADGRLIAQAEHIPMHLGALLSAITHLLKRYPKNALRPGDAFLANDPYNGGGTHLADVTVASPVFVGRELVGDPADPVGEPEDLVDDEHDRRLPAPLGIDGPHADRRAPHVDARELAVPRRGVQPRLGRVLGGRQLGAPRGGGRDRDKMIGHVIDADHAYARELGLRGSAPRMDDRAAIEAERDAVIDILRLPSDGSPLAGRRWTTRSAAARIAWHALDHAWEMEDRAEPEAGEVGPGMS